MLAGLTFASVLVFGQIRTSHGSPLARANVSWNGGQASSGADGSFVMTPGSDWPEFIRVSASGFGTRFVRMPSLHARQDLDPIVMAPGGTVRIHVPAARPSGLRRYVTLFLPLEGVPWPWLLQQQIDSGEHTVTVPDVGPGKYLVRVRGTGPLQYATRTVIVTGDETRDVDFSLTTRIFSAHFTSGDEPLKHTNIRFRKLNDGWGGIVTTDDHGDVHTPMWDEGDCEMSVQTPGVTFVPRIIYLTGRRRSAIDLPSRLIRGIVQNERGVPIAEAKVILHTSLDTGAINVHTRTDRHGVFAFSGISTGPQSVQVAADGYLIAPFTSFSGDDIRITMHEGILRRLTVMTTDGEPVSGAQIICSTGMYTQAMTATDAFGGATIATPADVTSVIYIIPREGSFFVQRISNGEKREPVQPLLITLQRPTAELTLEARSTAGTPVKNLRLLVRFNGEMIVPDAAEALEVNQGLQFRTGDDGDVHLKRVVPGVYEFFPYGGSAADMVDSIGVGDAPILVEVLPGENRATVTLAARK